MWEEWASSRKAEPISPDEEAFPCRVKSLANNAKAIVYYNYYSFCYSFFELTLMMIPEYHTKKELNCAMTFKVQSHDWI